MFKTHQRSARAAERQPVGWPGRYRLDDGPFQVWGDCRVLDVSAFGAGFEIFGAEIELFGSPRRLVDTRRLTVEVTSADGGGTGVHLRGEIRNAAPGDHGGVRVGVEFTELTLLEREILKIVLEQTAG
jgi:hypothetical protein